MGAEKVLIVGAGAAGLAAARELSGAGHDVIIIEARNRLGGRIHTAYPKSSVIPIELGAEFIHGDRNVTWSLASAWEDFETTEAPDRHWEFRNGKLRENPHFWDELGSVMEKLEDADEGQSFASFMRRVRGVPTHARSLARDYVEGFHAARPDEIGVVALAEAEEAAAKSRGQRQFHVVNGYASIVSRVAEELIDDGARIELETAVDSVCWSRGKVELGANGKSYSGRAVIITVPLGVLQQNRIKFGPMLPDKLQAATSLRMGHIVKLILAFEHAIWPAEVSGFIHAHGAPFPTWWIHERAPVITGWAGGPKADALGDSTDDDLLKTAVGELARIFGNEKKTLTRALRDSFRHDWRRDSFARGAYSYVPAGANRATACLSEPVEGTIYFAGEALAPAGEQGTVHGALASGINVARRVCESLRIPSQGDYS